MRPSFLLPCLVSAALAACGADAQDAERSEPVLLDVDAGRIAGRAYFGGELEHPVLAVVLHGDLLEPDDSYHYDFARTVASQMSNVVVVGLLRPGYGDEGGNWSDGDMLLATGDNYTADVAEAVAQATEQLKERYDARTAVLIGHSGGAAVSALVLGRHPDAANAALLLACPCDLPAWRAHMGSTRPSPIWRQPHEGLSPIDFASGVKSSALVEVIVGADDVVTPPEYSEAYAAALTARGVDARLSVLPDLGHNILRRPPVVSMTIDLMDRAGERAPE